MEFRVLGPMEVDRDGRAVDVGSGRQRALLAALLVRRNEVVSVDRLVDELWSERPPRTAANVLQVYVSRLRRSLGRDVIVTSEPGYMIQVAPGQLDAERFETLVAEARHRPPPQASALLRDALAVWRGPPLSEFTYEPFAQGEIARLDELRLLAFEMRVEADLELGRHADVVAELQEQARLHPFRERLHALLMLALYRCGRQADALAAYRAAGAVLMQELGIEPGEQLRRLEQSILTQDPALLTVSQQPEPAAETPTEERRTATFLFCDLVGSTALGAALDPEYYRGLLDRYVTAVESVAVRHGGSVVNVAGDGVLLAFGIPGVHEDDALRAVRAGAELPPAVAAIDQRLEVRVGIDTGEVLLGRDTTVVGNAVNVAAKLQSQAEPGEVLLGDATAQLCGVGVVLEEETIHLKGRGEPLPAWRLVEIRPEAAPVRRRLDVPLIGRDGELAVLLEAQRTAAAEPRVVLFTVVGAAGIGKSRLANEFCARLGRGPSIAIGRCQAYGEGVTYRPVEEIIRTLLGTDPLAAVHEALRDVPDAELVALKVAQVIGLATGVASPEDTAWAIRRLVETLAEQRPIVLIFEDIHWAEPALLDLIWHLAASPNPRELFLLCLARPDLLEGRPDWRSSLALGPLASEAAATLVDELLDERPIATKARDRILAIAEGNPLFLEQILAAGEATGAEDPLVPASIQTLLAARLERLGPGERAVLLAASVLGREFDRLSLSHLVPEARHALDRYLESLVDRGFLEPWVSAFGDGFRFRHVLMRDVARALLPRTKRAALHERVAAGLEATGRDEDAVVGFHLEQAWQCRVSVSEPDEQSDDLAHRAGRRLAAAASREAERGDARAMRRLAQRATRLLPIGDEIRVELLIERGRASHEAGDLTDAKEALDRASDEAATGAHQRLVSRARLWRMLTTVDSTPGMTFHDLLAASEAAAQESDTVGDLRSAAEAWYLVAQVRAVFGQCEPAARAYEESRRRADGAGDVALAAIDSSRIAGLLTFGPTPVPDALEAVRAIIGTAGYRLNLMAWATVIQGSLTGMAGDIERGRTLVSEGVQLHEELGLEIEVATAAFEWAPIELLAGDPAAAERQLREACDRLSEMGSRTYLSSAAAMHAEALLAQRRTNEAEAALRTAEHAGSDDDLHFQVHARAVRARLLSHAGAAADAEQYARGAAALAGQTDSPELKTAAQLALAEVMAREGRVEERDSALRQALALFERKGHLIGANHTKALLGELVWR